MKLLTKDILKKFPKLYETDEVPKDQVKVIAKFFTPDAQCSWFAVEYDGEDTFFGLCDLGMGFPELGYFSLAELQSIRGGLGLPVERDRYFEGTLKDVMD